MAIKLGTNKWISGEQAKSVDFNDTFDAVMARGVKGHAEHAYKTLDASGVFENSDGVAADKFTTVSGVNGTLSSTDALFDTDKYMLNEVLDNTGTEIYANGTLAVWTNKSNAWDLNPSTYAYTETNNANEKPYIGKTFPEKYVKEIYVDYKTAGYSWSYFEIYNGSTWEIIFSRDNGTGTRYNDTISINQNIQGIRLRLNTDNTTNVYLNIYVFNIKVGFSLNGIIVTNTLHLDNSESITGLYLKGERPTDTDIKADISDVNIANLNATHSGFGTDALALDISPDGTKLFKNNASGIITTYNLSTPWDLSTATIGTTATFSGNVGFTFKSDGTKLYTMNDSSEVISEYNLSTPWNPSTATLHQTSAALTAISGNNIRSIRFSPDGLYLLTQNAGNTTAIIPLSVAWNVSTLLTGSATINTGLGNLYSADISPDGTKIIACYSSSPNFSLKEYELTTPWDITTATLVFTLNTIQTVYGAKFKSDGSKFFSLSGNILEFNIFDYKLITDPITTISDVTFDSKGRALVDISTLGTGTLQIKWKLSTTDTTRTPLFYGYGVYTA